MTASIEPARSRDRADLETWVRAGRRGGGCVLLFRTPARVRPARRRRCDQRDALAALWPLSVDGLLLLATVGLLKPGHRIRRMRVAVWVAFLGCIAVSLAANIAAAPRLAWQPVLVAGWPPVALLLAVELLAHRSRSRRTEIEPAASVTESAVPVVERDGETTSEAGRVVTLAEVSTGTGQSGEPTAQEIMWAHFLKEQEHGRTPTGAELDRVAKTNNYGRTVLRQWREQGRISATNGNRPTHGGAA